VWNIILAVYIKRITREKGKVTAEVNRHGEIITLQSRVIVIATGFGTQAFG